MAPPPFLKQTERINPKNLMPAPGHLNTLRQLVSNDSQLASVEQFQAANGASAGDRVIIGKSIGGFHFTIHPDRGLDLSQLEFNGQPLGWVGPSGFPAANRFAPEGEDGLGILRAFSGFLVTCGYDYFGLATESGAEHFDYVLRSRQTYPVHGRAWTLPANLEICRIDWDAPGGAEIVVEGTLSQRTLLGEQIVNRRTYRFAVGRAELRLEDRITNVGHKPVPHRMLYHVNLGYPLIDDNTVIEGLPEDPAMKTPMEPVGSDQDERVRFIDRSACAQTIHIRRPEPDGLKLSMEPIGERFQKIIQWWNRYPGMNVVGIEPASAPLPEIGPDGRWEPDIWLQPGETADYTIRFSA